MFEKFLQTRDRRTYEIYKRKRTEVKRRIKETKKEADERWEVDYRRILKEIKKILEGG